MKPKFKIGDIIVLRDDLEEKREIIDITKNFEKRFKGNWSSGKEERLIPENSYILKNPKTNKLTWDYIDIVDNSYRLLQPVVKKPLKWKNYEEILV